MLKKAVVMLSLVLVAALAGAPQPGSVSADGGFTLTILHNNDASSRLLNAGPGLEAYGGVARFKTLVDLERAKATASPNSAAVVLSAGNSIEVGPNLEASINHGVPFYDAVAMRAIGYDAVALGSQDFGLGPDVLAALLCSVVQTGDGPGHDGCDRSGRSVFPFLAANLGFEHEPGLQTFADAGGIAASTVVTKGSQRIGIVGVTTPDLAVISTPRNTTVMSNISGLVQAEIDRVTGEGVNKIVVLAELGSIDDEVSLTRALRGVDVVVAGGTGALLSNPGDLLVPGDHYDSSLRYPLYATAKDGARVPIVTVGGGYTYLGKLVVEFDAAGNVVWIDPGSGPIRVAALSEPDGVKADPILVNAVEKPVQAYLDSLSGSVIATSNVALDGRTSVIRTQETNLGDLMADAALWQARQLADEFGVAHADVAILNAGAFRLDGQSQPGPLTRLDTYEIAPFASFISVVEDVSPAELKQLLENAVSQLPQESGRFGQIAGMTVTYDATRPALAFDASGAPVTDGARVRSVRLDDGTYIVQDGAVVAAAPAVTVATLDFMARGGDQYPFEGPFTSLGVSYRQALEHYVVEGLDGVIGASQYGSGGSMRLVAQ